MSHRALSLAAACLFERAAQRLQAMPSTSGLDPSCLWQCHQAALSIGSRRIHSCALPGALSAATGLISSPPYSPNERWRSFQTSAAPQAEDYYKLLGVSKTASESELKKAYYQLAKKLHPDANPNDQAAAKRFQEVTQAYDTLKDPQKRRIYDQVGPEGMDGSGGGGGFNPFGGQGGFSWQSQDGSFSFSTSGGATSAEEIFNQFFGGGGAPFEFGAARQRQRRKTGIDLQLVAGISFMEAAKGGRKSFTFGGGHFGGGYVPRKTVDLDIPAGVDTGTVMSVPGQGMPAEDKDGTPGNLMVELQVERHPVFTRDNYNIHQNLDVDFVDMILGAELRVPTLDADATITVQSGTQDGAAVRLSGYGIKQLRTNRKGDMIVHLHVVLPRMVSERQRQLLLDFAEADKQRRAA